MRCAHGDQGAHRRAPGIGAPPGPQRQPSHAVADQQRCAAGALPELPDRCGQHGHMRVQRGPGGLQRHRHGRNAQGTQAPQPGVPDGPVAQVAMHQQHARAPCGCGRPDVGFGVGSKGLPPGEHPGGGPALGPPGAPSLRHGGRCHPAGPLHAAHQQHRQTQPGGVSAQRQRGDGQGQRRVPLAPGQAGDQPPEHDAQQQRRPLPAGDHPSSDTGRPDRRSARALLSRAAMP